MPQYKAFAVGLALLAIAPAVQAAGIVGYPGKTYQNATSNGAYKWFDDRKAKPTCDGCTFKNITLTVDRYGWQFLKSKNVTLDGVKVTHRRVNSGGDLPAAVAIVGGSNITVRNFEFRNFQMVAVKGKYTNGDGADCDNRDVTGVVFEDGITTDNSDAGLDLKCEVTVNRVTSERNYRNFRFWGKMKGGTLTSRNPRNAHVWFSSGAKGVVDTLIAEGDTGAPVFASEPPKTDLTFNNCRYNFGVPTKVFGTKGQVPGLKVGPSCMPDAKGYAINYVAGVCRFKTKLRDSNGDGIIELGDVNRAKCGGHPKVRLIEPKAARTASEPAEYVYEKAA